MAPFQEQSRLHMGLLYGAYGWLLVSGLLQFGLTLSHRLCKEGTRTRNHVVLRPKHRLRLEPGAFALLALFAIRQGLDALGRWPGVALGLVTAAGWLGICFRFLEYSQPRTTVLLFVALLLGAAFTF